MAECSGERRIIPTIGVLHREEGVNSGSLPDRLALKCTHDSDRLVICKEKETLDKNAAKEKINRCLKQNFYFRNREWAYKNVQPQIIAEEYMEDSTTGEQRDYKLFRFDGEPKALFVATDRQTPGEEVEFEFFDMNYDHIDVRNGHENAKVMPEKPK